MTHATDTTTAKAARQPMTADRLFEELQRRNVMQDRARMEREIGHIKERLSSEELLRLAYVPFVIARLVWDYADTVLSLCYMMRLTEAKPLATAVRKLRREYDQDRAPFIDKEHEDSEEANMLVYEEKVRSLMRLYMVNLDCAISREFASIPDECRNLLRAVYQCRALAEALFAYTDRWTGKAAAKLGWRMGSMLPDTVHRLRGLIIEFAGDMRLSEEWELQERKFIETFANQIGLVEFRSTK